MKKIIHILIIASLAAACSPRIVENVRTQIEYRDRIQRDSLYVHDSIYVHQFAKNDTMYLDKYIYKYAYKDRYVHDTTYIARHDTTVVEKEVPAKLTRIQQAKLDSFGWLLAALSVLVLWCVRKPLLALVRRFI